MIFKNYKPKFKHRNHSWILVGIRKLEFWGGNWRIKIWVCRLQPKTKSPWKNQEKMAKTIRSLNSHLHNWLWFLNITRYTCGGEELIRLHVLLQVICTPTKLLLNHHTKTLHCLWLLTFTKVYSLFHYSFNFWLIIMKMDSLRLLEISQKLQKDTWILSLFMISSQSSLSSF